ncbi:LLM class flavin-dependent oxidoreductase [Haliangium ochraceum]|uniref:Alkanesulfonate monooxygenase n=1 Tax=Haliangium ochraceum (strain DSM 14365 / JCM 11303 / SMP-2) TaxID=502025 RepID=D0LK44_HALO1|nr:LLM class flavin-dependent oxidoreductase [Haliangium ochraceum]ACY13078.1 Alkanesulfonate monooxygenase [Haliangium ochraceum DSM 14365]
MNIDIRTPDAAVEMAWFADLCNGDYELLGVPESALRSNFTHCADMVRTADRLGYQNILLPSSYQVGQDTLSFAAGVAPMTEQISLLTAVRMGEVHPPMLARALSTLDHMLAGRLTVNIISSDLPGTQAPSAERYRRASEVVAILRQAWTQERIAFEGEFYQLDLPSEPVAPYQQNGGPLLYFGGISDGARALCAEHCDVFLMWPETEAQLRATMSDMSQRAAAHGRRIDFGYRVHVIVRESENEARAAARRLVSQLSDERGAELKHRSLDSRSAGVQRQDVLREHADDEGYIEDHLWSGIGRGRSGCGSAIVGDPDQVYEKLQRYVDMGVRAFILSGYPLIDECELFARYVLPRMRTTRLARVQGRLPEHTPETPLTTAPRR